MAIGANSIVSPKTTGVGGGGLNPLSPLFGIVESGAGPFTVLWFNGQRVASIVLSNLDEILAGSGTIAAELVGREVKVSSPAGQTNYGQFICVTNYNRNGSEFVLLQNKTSGYYFEALAANCTAA
jgi:hypothetical protein